MIPKQLLKIILPHLTKGAHFLDLGGGEGEDSLFMAKRGLHVTAIDQSPELTEKLQQKIKDSNLTNIEVICQNVRGYPIEKDKYSIINAINVFQFLKKKVALRIINDLKEKLKEGGYLIIECFTIKDPLFIKTELKENCFLKPNELKNVFSDWKIIHYQEKLINDQPHSGCNQPHHHGIVRLIAQKVN